MKFIELLKHKSIRPKQIKSIEGILNSEDGQTALVYEFEDMDNHRRYIGMHKAMEKPYWTSATDKDFQKVLMNPDSNLKLTIHRWGSVQEMKQLEYEMLTKVDAAKHKGYYNKHNGHPGVKEIDYDKIAQLRNELDFIRDNRHDKVNEFQIIGFEYLSDKKYTIEELKDWSKLQVRYETIDRDNLEKIKSKIRISMGNTDEAKPPVYLKDVDYEGEHYDMLLISGNHTITAYYDLGGAYRLVELPIIVLGPEIHTQFSDAELFALGNELNSEKFSQKSYSKEDAEKECLRFYELGNTWKCERNTIRMIKLGLTTNQVKTVYERVEQLIINNKKRKGGWNVMDYEGEHRIIVDELIEKNTTDDIFVCDYSGAAMKLQNILISYWNEQNKRLSLNMPIQKRILCYVRFTSETARDNYWPKLKSQFQILSQKEKLTPIDYIELEMYTKDTK
jgi:hypothetical protein